MAGYTRQSTFSDGDTITAAIFNNEYNQVVNAFHNQTGHKHDGTLAEGPVIGVIGDSGQTTPLNKVLIDSTNDHIEFWIDVSSSSVQQFYVADGVIAPVTDSDIDLGTSSLYWKDAYIDSITTTGNVGVGGNLTVTGTTTFNGGTLNLGDSASDNIVFGGEVDSHIIPDDDGTFDLGSSTKEWRDIFIDGTAHIDTLDVDVNATVAGTLGVTGDLTGTNVTASTAFLPDASDGASLGTSSLEFSDLFLADGAVINLGDDQDVTLTHVADTGVLLNSTNKIQFNDASQFIHGSSATVLSLGATDEIDLTATAIDINGTADISGNTAVGGTFTSTGKITADAGIDIDNFNIDGTTIALSSGDMTVDAAGDIILDADGADVFIIRSGVSTNGDPIIFRANLSSPAGFLAAGNFNLLDNDIVYVNAKGTTRWNRVISQFFPFSTFLNSIDNLTNN